MKTTGHKYKSLLLSLFIHLLLGALVIALFYQACDTQKSYSLVNLKTANFCSPSIECFCERDVQEVKVKKASTVSASKKIQKQIKPIPKKPMVKKEAAVAKVESLPIPKKIENVEQDRETIEEQTEAIADSKEREESSIVTTKQSLTYEAQYMEDNLALINALIKKNLSYPKLARKRGLQGKVMVSFMLDVKGEVTNIDVSGNVASILKKSAIKTIQKASASFPKTQDALRLQIPIVYKLR